MQVMQQTLSSGNHLHQLYAGTQNGQPLMMVYSTWAGITEFEQTIASRLNVLGFDVLLVDIFGDQTALETVDQRRAAIGDLMANMPALQQRLQDIEAFVETAIGHQYSAITTSGYCFGGLCSLLSGFLFKRISAAASFHALLKVPTHLQPQNPNVRILVMSGYRDPLISAEERQNTEAHFNQLGLDWTLIQYGRAMHSFALPHANAPEHGSCHDAATDRRSWKTFVEFIQES
jgi:dienelactone hydrolase